MSFIERVFYGGHYSVSFFYGGHYSECPIAKGSAKNRRSRSNASISPAKNANRTSAHTYSIFSRYNSHPHPHLAIIVRDTCTHLFEGVGSLIIGEAPGEFGVNVHVLVEVALQLYSVGLGLAVYEMTERESTRTEEHEGVT